MAGDCKDVSDTAKQLGRKIFESLTCDDLAVPKAGADLSKRLCIKEYANLYGVHANTVRRWIREGCVKWEQQAGKKGKIFIIVTDSDKQ